MLPGVVAGALTGLAALYIFDQAPTEKHQDIAPKFPDEDDDEPKVKTLQPINIYEDRSRTYVINLEGSNREPVEIPRPRLPEEADNQTSTQTARGKSIDIKKSVFKHTFGKLLVNPINDFLMVYDYDAPHVQRDFEEAQEKGIEILKTYLSNRDDEGKILEKDLRIEELGLIMLPEEWRGFSGELGMIYSHEALSIINRDYTVRSTTAFMTPRIKAYKNYIKLPKVPKNERTSIKQPKEDQEAGLSVSNLGRIYDFLGIDTLYRVLDPKLEIDTLLEKFGNALYLQPNEEKQPGKPEEELKYNPQSWGITSLLELYTALIAAGFWKLGLNNFPAKVPKDLSAMPSIETAEQEGLKERTLDDAYFSSLDPENPQNNNLYIEGDPIDPTEFEKGISEEFDERYYQKVYSLGEFLSWQTKQLDALTGAFPIEIKVQDNDLLKVGEQEKIITLPNIAETLAELIGQSITQGALIDAISNITLRNLQETGSSRTQAITTYYLLESIADYLGFKLSKKEKEVEFMYNPLHGSDPKQAESIEAAMQPTKVKIAIEQYDDKDSLERHMTVLTEAARIIRARFWRNVDVDHMENLKVIFKDAKKIIEKEDDKPKKPGQPEEKSDFDLFLEQIETGFIDSPGITDKEHPYGKDFNNRPKIKEIGENDAD